MEPVGKNLPDRDAARGRIHDMALHPFVATLVLALAAGCGGSDATVSDDAAAGQGRAGSGPATSASAESPSGALILLPLREDSLMAIDVRSGEIRRRQVPELGPGDALYHLSKTGDRLVFYGDSATYALGLDLRGPPTALGESWYFVPSATEGRVWLTSLDEASPETVRDLKAVREVTVDGRVTARSAGPPPCGGPTVVAAVEVGVLCQDGGLVVWEPATGKVLKRLDGPYPLDTHKNVVAWCRDGCPELHLADIAAGEETVVTSGRSFSFNETYDGAFSPDGTLLAVPVTVSGRTSAVRGGSDGVALVDVRAGTAELIEGSRSGVYTAFAWSPAGDWLFFTTGDGGLMASHHGTGRAITLPAKVPGAVLGMVAR